MSFTSTIPDTASDMSGCASDVSSTSDLTATSQLSSTSAGSVFESKEDQCWYPFEDVVMLYTHAPPPPMLDNIVVQVPRPGESFWYLPPEVRALVIHEIWKTKKPFELKLPTKSDQSRIDRETLHCKVQFLLDGPVSNPTGALPSRGRRLP
jgi:hypothetical protein